eukprot:7665946-Alexandrium_andersonii.AAC.1
MLGLESTPSGPTSTGASKTSRSAAMSSLPGSKRSRKAASLASMTGSGPSAHVPRSAGSSGAATRAPTAVGARAAS